MAGKKHPFMPEAAKHYAEKMGWKLPKKFKSPVAMAEMVKEYMEVSQKGIKEDDRFECGFCGSLVAEPDEYCWYCGGDTTEEGDGGFQAVLDSEKEEETEEEETEEEETEEEETEEEEEPKSSKKKDTEKKDTKKKDTKKKAAPKKETKKKETKKKETKKKETKKKETKKKDVEEEETEEEESTALVPSNKEKSIFKSLKEYTKAITVLSVSAGESAWKIGKYLLEVQESKKFNDGGYETMSDYVQSELEYTWQSARNHMRYASLVDVEQAASLGIFKMELLSRCPDDVKEVFLKAALPKKSGGKGLTRSQLESKLKEECDKAKEIGKSKKGAGRGGNKPQPNKRTTLHDLIGTSVMVRTKDKEGFSVIPDTECILEVKELKSGVKITFYQAEDEGE